MKYARTLLLALSLVSAPVMAGYSLKAVDGTLIFTDAPCPDRIADIVRERGIDEEVVAKMKAGIAQPDDKKEKSVSFCYVTVRKGILGIVSEHGVMFTMEEPIQI